MTRILFLSFFGFREYILDIKNEFTDQGYVVEQTPYLSLKQDNKMTDDQIILEIKKVVFSDPLNPIKFMMMFILPSNANFIKNLKTACSISDDGMKHNLLTVFYNFDDPVSINVDLLNYSRDIDLFITPLEESIDKLKILLSPMTQIHHSPAFITDIPEYTEIPEAQKTTDIVVFYDTSREYVYDIKKMLIEIILIDYFYQNNK
jgi:hypothetical protein